ncbi:MAG: MoaD/ThiS family protein [Deltaproteobacteria bacterium]|nr:MoaD/ThiS family protein [Deltaproteobacteria bacterium]
MVTVELTRHLYTFFPHLQGQAIAVQATTLAEVVAELEKLAPGIGFYLCDEAGRLRTHVHMFIGNDMIRDRRRLSDPVTAGDKVTILQALSGG